MREEDVSAQPRHLAQLAPCVLVCLGAASPRHFLCFFTLGRFPPPPSDCLLPALWSPALLPVHSTRALFLEIISARVLFIGLARKFIWFFFWKMALGVLGGLALHSKQFC